MLSEPSSCQERASLLLCSVDVFAGLFCCLDGSVLSYSLSPRHCLISVTLPVTGWSVHRVLGTVPKSFICVLIVSMKSLIFISKLRMTGLGHRKWLTQGHRALWGLNPGQEGSEVTLTLEAGHGHILTLCCR